MPASEPLSIAHGAAIDRAHEAAAMRAIKWMRVLPRPLVRTRIKKLVGEEVYRCIDASAPTTVVHGGMGPLVLNLLPFFKHVFVTMCPMCPGVEDSSALMPLLEQGFVVPVLLGPTASYPARFIQHIAAYPHIPAIVYFYLQVAQLEIHERGWAKPHLCRIALPICTMSLYKRSMTESPTNQYARDYSVVSCPVCTSLPELLKQFWRTLRNYFAAPAQLTVIRSRYLLKAFRASGTPWRCRPS